MKKLLFIPLLFGIVLNSYSQKVLTYGSKAVTYSNKVLTYSAYCDEYQSVYDAFTTKPDATNAGYQNTLVSTLVDNGLWAKLDYLNVYAVHSGGADALLDWKQPAGGSDVVINGGFDTDSDWTKQAGWTISGGKAVGAATTGYIYETIGTATIGKTYKITFTISDYAAGTVKIIAGSTHGTFRSGNGTYSEILTYAAEGRLYFDAGTAFTGKIDNVTVIEWTNALAVNSPTFTASQGFTGNGSTSYINSRWNPSVHGVNYTQNSGSVGIYVRTNGVAANKIETGEGGAGGANGIFIAARYTGDNAYVRMNSGNSSAGVNADSKGMFIANRVLSTHQDLYKNSSRIVNAAVNSTGINSNNIYVLCNNGDGSAGSFSTEQISMFFAGSGLSQADVTLLTNAINQYMTALGTNVFGFPLWMFIIVFVTIKRKDEKDTIYMDTDYRRAA